MTLRDTLGTDLHDQLTPGQRDAVAQAVDEAPDGVRKIVAELRAAGTKIDRPVAVLLNRIDRGVHRDRQADLDRTNEREHRMPSRDAYRRLFEAKRDDLVRHGRWPDDPTVVDDAIDYAASYLDRIKTSGPTDTLELERDLRHALGQPDQPTLDLDERSAMARDWTRILYSLHDPRISAMRNAMTSAGTDPSSIRAALIAELDHLGVKPHLPGTHQPTGDLEPIGASFGITGPAPQQTDASAAADDDDHDLPW